MDIEPEKVATLFYCYAHQDEALLGELEKHLSQFKRLGQITSWHDRHILAGASWQEEIERHLNMANLILLLLSPDFIYSDACNEEMRLALEMAQAGQAQVIPILLRPVIWENTPLADLQLLPEDGKAITRWRNRDEAFRQVAYSIGNKARTMLSLPPMDTYIPAKERIQIPVERPQILSDDPSFVPRNPYRGLLPFTEKDATYFFGREHLVTELIEKLQPMLALPPHSKASRLLTIVGPSGSGKSSVVMAGLLPTLQHGALPGSERWLYLHPLVPGPHPLESLARILSFQFPQRSLTSLQEDLGAPSARGLHLLEKTLTSEDTPLVALYIDQFEELFTQTLEEAEREQFINLLVTAVTEPHGTLLALLSLRADFYDRPMHFHSLFQLMQASQAAVLPLSHRDLRDVIKKPAALPDVRLSFEDDLVGELLYEMRGQSGALPLLQFTLDRLFQQRKGQELTLSAYYDIGGIQGALVQHAEATYAALPSKEHRRLTKNLFMRLVEPGAFDQDATRRRAALSELVLADKEKAEMLKEVAYAFITARLLTTTTQDEIAVIEVSHETVIRSWPRLAEWLREAYEDLYLQKRIREDAAIWNRLGHPLTRLYRDDQLAEALAWKERSLLSREEEDFLVASSSEQALNKQQKVQQQKLYRRRIVIVGLVGLGLATTAAITSGIFFHSSPALPVPLPLPFSYHGHTHSVNSVAWSPDGNRIASASSDTTVQVWNAINGSHLFTYTGHTEAVFSVAWSPDSRYLASAGYDNTVQMWNSTSGRHLLTYIGHTDAVNSVVWSPDGKRLASASKTVQVWDATSGSHILTYIGHTNAAFDAAWSPDGKYLASASADKTVQVWNSANGSHLLTYTGHTDGVNSVIWSPDGKRLASSSNDKTAQVWNSTNGSRLLTYTGHTDAVQDVAWSPNGKHIASASFDMTVQIWDSNNGNRFFTYRGHTDVVQSVTWSPDGKRLVSGSNDASAQVWDTDITKGNITLTYTGHTGAVFSVAWSPDGKYLASGSADKTVQVWNSTNEIRRLTYRGHSNTVDCVAWSPDGQRLASGSDDKTAQVWNSTNGSRLLTYTGHTDAVQSVAWSPDSKYLASASNDKTVQIWDSTNGKRSLTYTGHTATVQSVAWSPDGRHLASASADKTVHVWDSTSGRRLLTYTGHTDMVLGVAWSPDGTRLASASYDDTVEIWTATLGSTLFTYHGHDDVVTSVAWSPDSKRLATTSTDMTTQVWPWLQS